MLQADIGIWQISEFLKNKKVPIFAQPTFSIDSDLGKYRKNDLLCHYILIMHPTLVTLAAQHYKIQYLPSQFQYLPSQFQYLPSQFQYLPSQFRYLPRQILENFFLAGFMIPKWKCIYIGLFWSLSTINSSICLANSSICLANSSICLAKSGICLGRYWKTFFQQDS